jgi:zinc transporter ZupT
MNDRLLWITAGGFLYLAGTTILPEVLNDKGPSQTKTRQLTFRLAQLVAFCTGILFLSMVDWFSGDDHHHHNGEHFLTHGHSREHILHKSHHVHEDHPEL